MSKTVKEEIADNLAEELKQAIDNELMADMLVAALGWTKIKRDYYLNNRDAIDRRIWLEENCQGHYKSLGIYIVFEDSRDATMYVLKWS